MNRMGRCACMERSISIAADLDSLSSEHLDAVIEQANGTPR
jgi:hypothetical protein